MTRERRVGSGGEGNRQKLFWTGVPKTPNGPKKDGRVAGLGKVFELLFVARLRDAM